ncbi:MAG TPA: protein-glutamate O-methyltransferase CheR [Pseudomonas xinjiangensis]|uniref:protein-glutamate O-methyltransferase n=2 Tax=root TaxID=1 RepID=A0A7V1BPP5_9GAMM|nr:protein-glutamate O-methyltransferase CheR [Halopseudomonas xinjiangensis]HEC49297.1 protein-glutamate O-methyltransferase CheR [Halopseudomonas xinjiangensis]
MSKGHILHKAPNWSLQQLPEMDDQQFRQWQTLLESRTGVCVGEQRKLFLQTSLCARMREKQVVDYQAYYEHVTNGPLGAIEWSALMDNLTVRETSFMRHRPSFDCVARHLSGLLRDPQRKQAIQLWSVGCASGEEAYSLAIIVEQCLKSTGVKSPGHGVWATDISLKALEQGRSALYSGTRLGGLTESERATWLRPSPDGRHEILPAVRDRVCFTRLNILELAQAPIRDLDIIFCQNLLIYFRRWRRRDLLNLLAKRLAPGGMLIIGLGEIVDWKNPLLERVPDDRVQAYVRRESTGSLE